MPPSFHLLADGRGGPLVTRTPTLVAFELRQAQLFLLIIFSPVSGFECYTFMVAIAEGARAERLPAIANVAVFFFPHSHGIRALGAPRAALG